MPVVPAATRRVVTTPNATMTTLASPTLGGAASSLWLVEMLPGACGPWHSFDAEVVWSISGGEARLEADDEAAPQVLGVGDTVVLPGGVLRRFTAGAAGFVAIVSTPGPGVVTREDGTSAGVPAWVA